MKDRSSATLNLSWAGLGDLVIKRYFETGLGSRQALSMTRRGGGVRQKVILYDKGGFGSDICVFPPTKWQFLVYLIFKDLV